MVATSYSLPSIAIQSDWDQVVHDVLKGSTNESFWVSAAVEGRPTFHGRVMVRKRIAEEGVLLDGEEAIDGKLLTENSINLKFCDNAADISTTLKDYHAVVKASNGTFALAAGTITTIDLSPSASLLLIGLENGMLKILDTTTGATLRDLKGHVGSITTAQFFPSGEVILSSGIDTQVKIWSAIDGSNPVTLGSSATQVGGHKSRIIDTKIVDRGKNVITASKDGSVKLWECSSTNVIATLYSSPIEVNEMCLVDYLPFRIESCSDYHESMDSREVGTNGKLLILGLDDGTLQMIDVGRRRFVAHTPPSSSITSCAAVPELNWVISVSAEGIVAIWDLYDLCDNIGCSSSPLYSFRRGSTFITSITPIFNGDQVFFTISTMDGTLYVASVPASLNSPPTIRFELSGSDLEPILAVKVHVLSETRFGDCMKFIVWAAGREGVVRKYDLVV